MPLSDLLDFVGRLGIDVLSMLLLVGWLYRRRLAAPEMALVYTALNIGLFAAVSSIGTGHFPTGVGFGLFGLLSLVRLRSTAFTLKDVAYTFIALVLALVNGLPGRDLLLVVDVARGLGKRIWLARLVGLTAITLLCGAATAACGPIAFVGLVVPHAVRALTGPDHRWLLPYAGLLGALLLLVSDVAGRLLARPAELPIGVVTAFVGAPFFVVVLRRATDGGAS